MKKALALALFAAAGALGACSSVDKEARAANPGVCPNVFALSEAARAIEFDGEETLENIAYTAEIIDIKLDCRYYGTEPIDATVTVEMAFGRGPKGASPEHNFAYFVAVTRTDREVIEKAEYLIPVKFDKGENIATHKDVIEEIIIPRANETTAGTNFEVIVGLVVTPQQAIFNRSGTSLKFPDL